MSDKEISELHRIINQGTITRRMRTFLDKFMAKHNIEELNLTKKQEKRLAEILEPAPKEIVTRRSSRKRSREDDDESDLPLTKRQRKEHVDLLNIMIEKDRESRKQNNFIKFIFSGPLQPPPFMEPKFKLPPRMKSKDDKEEKKEDDKKTTRQGDLIIVDDDDYDSEEDEDVNPEEMQEEAIEEAVDEIMDALQGGQIAIGGRGGNFLEIIGRGRKKEELDLKCIETEEEKEKIKQIYEEVKQINDIKTPMKIKVLKSNLPLKAKAMIIKKLESMEGGFESSDGRKWNDWMESVLKLPFGKYCDMPISSGSSDEEIGTFFNNFYAKLDKSIYGHKNVKQALTETIAKWVTNPTVKGHAIAVVGPPGVGKTTLMRGLAEGLNRPFCSLSLAGMHDEAYLTGFALTYEGSQEGRISKMLQNCGCMNPIIFMDELDKIDTVRHGMSVMNKLIEITDFSQNHEFEDLYFQDIKLDLSKCIFVFSLNHLENVDPILRDRLEVIKVEGFKPDEKVHIAKEFLIPAELKEIGLKENDIVFPDKVLKHIIHSVKKNEEGVRTLKKNITKICRKLNILRFTKENTDFKKKLQLPIEVNIGMVDKILKDDKKLEPWQLAMYI